MLIAMRFRDLLVLDAPGQLVLACDSIGGIGPKPADAVSIDGRTTAHFGVRVPLLEVLCSGARPIALANALCLERNPSGQPMIDEIEALAAQAGIPAEAVTGSTEENAPTVMTGIGITVLGLLERPLPHARAGDVVICAGLPVSAPEFEIHIGHRDQVSVAEVRAVLASGLTHDALPVGSRGVAAELADLAAGLAIEWLPDHGVDLQRSGGPASCVLFACPPWVVNEVTALLAPGRPWALLARLSEPAEAPGDPRHDDSHAE